MTQMHKTRIRWIAQMLLKNCGKWSTMRGACLLMGSIHRPLLEAKVKSAASLVIIIKYIRLQITFIVPTSVHRSPRILHRRKFTQTAILSWEQRIKTEIKRVKSHKIKTLWRKSIRCALKRCRNCKNPTTNSSVSWEKRMKNTLTCVLKTISWRIKFKISKWPLSSSNQKKTKHRVDKELSQAQEEMAIAQPRREGMTSQIMQLCNLRLMLSFASSMTSSSLTHSKYAIKSKALWLPWEPFRKPLVAKSLICHSKSGPSIKPNVSLKIMSFKRWTSFKIRCLTLPTVTMAIKFQPPKHQQRWRAHQRWEEVALHQPEP